MIGFNASIGAMRLEKYQKLKEICIPQMILYGITLRVMKVWYRIKKRNLVDTYYSDYSITDFYDTTIDKKGDYAIIDGIIDYKHSLLGDYWQMKP